MAPKQRMSVANRRFSGNVKARGIVPKSLVKDEYQLPIPPWLLALFIFVVIGSAIFEILVQIHVL